MARQYVSAETRRLQIADAALRVLAEEGVGRFATRAIADRVGITDGTLFRHFADKQAIVLAAMDLLEEGPLVDMDEGGDPVARLEAMFRHRASFVGSNSSVGRLSFSEQLVHLAGEQGRDEVAGWRARSLRFMYANLEAARADGLTRPGVEALGFATVIQGVLLTFALQANIRVIRGTPRSPRPSPRWWRGSPDRIRASSTCSETRSASG